MNIPIEHCKSAKVFKVAPVRRGVLLAVLLCMYAFTLPFCYNTAGMPRAMAIERAQRLEDEKWASEASQNSTLAMHDNDEDDWNEDLGIENENLLSNFDEVMADSDSDTAVEVQVDEFGNVLENIHHVSAPSNYKSGGKGDDGFWARYAFDYLCNVM
jgi:hypothetical protein